MEAVMGLLKIVVVALSLLLGALCVYAGFGHEFRIFSYQGLAAYGIPIGIALFVFSALIAKGWTTT
jgi:hypothetical protein